MFIHKTWIVRRDGTRYVWGGWFLFGVLPLILKRVTV